LPLTIDQASPSGLAFVFVVVHAVSPLNVGREFAMQQTVIIKRRFCGPPQSGNGGYVCGLLGDALGGAATVRLFRPPPLEKQLTLTLQEGEAQLLDGDQLVAKGWRDEVAVTCPSLPEFADSVAAARHFSGFTEHAFPGCFVCGPERASGDGLRIFPGHLPDSPVVAAPWIPDASLLPTVDHGGSSDCAHDPDGNSKAAGQRVDRVFIWAALDCTSAFPMLPVPAGKALVLGQMSVQINQDVTVGEPCILLGWPVQQEGRKHHAASAVVGEKGAVVAVARATWVEVDASAFQ